MNVVIKRVYCIIRKQKLKLTTLKLSKDYPGKTKITYQQSTEESRLLSRLSIDLLIKRFRDRAPLGAGMFSIENPVSVAQSLTLSP